MTIDFTAKVMLYRDYQNMIDPVSGLARVLTEPEKFLTAKRIEGDLVEAEGIGQLYKAALKGATYALQKGNLKEFDATVGDHACQVPTHVTISAFIDGQLIKEAEELHDKINEVNLSIMRKKALGSPQELMQSVGLNLTVSKKMDYLVRAYILRRGQSLSFSSSGQVTIRIDAQPIKDKLSKNCPIDLVKRLIVQAKQQMNLDSLRVVQGLASSLKIEERACLEDRFTQVYTTPRGETLQFSCAFYNVKATIIDIARQGIPIALAAYHPKGVIQHPLFYFKASGEDAAVPRMILMENPPDKRDAVFVIEGFFNSEKSREEICRDLEGYGLIQFLLANIAVYPQFTDKQPHEYAEHEDIVHLPETERAEIQRYRQEGTKLGCRTDKPAFFSVAHIYPETFSNLQPKGDL
ncbi:MAG: hypothetical protein HKM07_04690 [Chlamydiae bacterium]|nr:hypothetical protein [Chlamydiota bacterium]